MTPPAPDFEAITYAGDATVLLELAGKRLVTNPQARAGRFRRRPAPARLSYAELDGVLLSEGRADLAALRCLPRDVPTVVGRGAGAALRRLGFTYVGEVDPGETIDLFGVSVTAVPAHHVAGRGGGFVHAATGSLGYVLAGRARVYFAGGTGVNLETVAARGRVDVALVPVTGSGRRHLDPLTAAQALTMLEPRIAVPIGWGARRGRFSREPGDAPQQFAAHAAAWAPHVRVEIVELGGTLALSDRPA